MSQPGHDDDRIESHLLESFAVPEPSADLVDRFAARLGERPAELVDRRRVRRRRLLVATGVGLIAAGAGAALLVTATVDRVQIEPGALSAPRRWRIFAGPKPTLPADVGVTCSSTGVAAAPSPRVLVSVGSTIRGDG